jgi:hypothetical protein
VVEYKKCAISAWLAIILVYLSVIFFCYVKLIGGESCKGSFLCSVDS